MNSLNPTEILQNLGYDDCIVMRQESRGNDSRVWKVMVDDGYATLRVLRPEQLTQFQFEIQAMNVASAAGVPVPPLLGFEVYRRNPCMLLEWVEGSLMFDECHSLEDIQRYGELLGRTLRTLHEDTTRQDGSCLIHMDYHPLNVLVNGEEVVGVLDWTNSAWGHPLQDVARTVMIFAASPLVDHEDRELSKRLRRMARAFLTGYGSAPFLKPFVSEAATWMTRELDHHIQDNGLEEPKGARRRLAHWHGLNS